jgi:hypothetical protein
MATATVLSAGGVSLTPVAGGHTGDLLASIAALFNDPIHHPDVVTVASNAASLPAAPTTGGANGETLVIPADYTGSLVIPPGYEFVVYAGTGTLTGGDPNTVVMGDSLHYSGNAGTVIGTSGGGNIVDGNAKAEMSFFSGTYSVQSAGDGTHVFVDSAAGAFVTLSGTNSFLTLGTASGQGGQANATSSVAGTNNSAILSGLNDAALVLTGDNTITATGVNNTVAINGASNNLVFITGTTTVNESAGNATIVTGQGGTVTLNATGGNEVVFDNAGGNLINAGSNTEFVGLATVPSSTFLSSGGADTIFALGSINYHGSTVAGSSALMLGGSGVATVIAASNETLFGGSGGGSYQMGGGFFFFFGGGGNDTISGDANSAAAIVWGRANENVVVSTASTLGNTFVSFGDNDKIDATNTHGGNVFQIVNQAIGAGTFTGNTTLVGSTNGGDTFVVYEDASKPAAHTVTIDNWKASDQMFVADLSNNQVLNAADSQAISNFLAGNSGTSFTLNDGTTVKFTNSAITTGFNIGHV